MVPLRGEGELLLALQDLVLHGSEGAFLGEAFFRQGAIGDDMALQVAQRGAGVAALAMDLEQHFLGHDDRQAGGGVLRRLDGALCLVLGLRHAASGEEQLRAQRVGLGHEAWVAGGFDPVTLGHHQCQRRFVAFRVA